MRDLTNQEAASLINKMRVMYGRKFDQQWGGVDAGDIAETLVDVLSGLSFDDIKRGLNRMKTEQWPPTLPEFRMWCEQSSDWLTADEAWAMALRHVSERSNEVTVATHKALGAVKYILENEGQQRAARAFKDCYSRFVHEFKEQGVRQSMHKPIAVEAPPAPRQATPAQLERTKAQAAEYIKNMKKNMGVV